MQKYMSADGGLLGLECIHGGRPPQRGLAHFSPGYGGAILGRRCAEPPGGLACIEPPRGICWGWDDFFISTIIGCPSCGDHPHPSITATCNTLGFCTLTTKTTDLLTTLMTDYK